MPSALGIPGTDVNYPWILDGRNKRSITLNLKSDEGQQVLRQLISECDATGVLSPPVEGVGVRYVINPPLFVEGVEQVAARHAPEVGEQADEVLATLGYDAETIAAWRNSGKI